MNGIQWTRAEAFVKVSYFPEGTVKQRWKSTPDWGTVLSTGAKSNKYFGTTDDHVVGTKTINQWLDIHRLTSMAEKPLESIWLWKIFQFMYSHLYQKKPTQHFGVSETWSDVFSSPKVADYLDQTLLIEPSRNA